MSRESQASVARGVHAEASGPTPTPAIYVVRKGDTLGAIAERFGTSVQAIVEANDLDNPDLLQVGQELVIPGGQPRDAGQGEDGG